LQLINRTDWNPIMIAQIVHARRITVNARKRQWVLWIPVDSYG
jgi:hypothetical protein